MYRTVWALAVAVLLGTLPGHAGGDEKPRLPDVFVLEQAMQEAIRRAEPAIACVLVSRSADPKQAEQVSDRAQVPESFGSGVVLDDKGLVLTNYHVVRDATRVYVRLPGNKGSFAEVHAADPRSDLAVLRLQDTGLALKALPLGDGGAVRKGQFVLSLANPYAAGFYDGSPSASWGIISNVRRRAPGSPREEDRTKALHHYGWLLQTDARLNLGCSGGALVNLKGELIGLTSSLAALSGAEAAGGFALPMDAGARRIIEVLKRGEEVEYGFLGVRLAAGEGGRGQGLMLDSVVHGSPAWAAELEPGFYLRAVNGVPVTDHDDLFLVVGTMLAGSSVRLEFGRTVQGLTERRTVRLAKFYVPGRVIAAKRPPFAGGLRVEYASVLYQRNLPPFGNVIPKGVVIREVLANSSADTARLQPDKLVTHVGGAEVNSPAEFYREMEKAKGTVELTLVGQDGRAERVKIEAR